MKDKKPLIIGVAVVALIALAAVLSRGPAEKPKTVLNSDDGVLALQIPDGSMPDGVTTADITIAQSEIGYDPDPFAEDGEGAELVAAYELGPDGTTFSEPVTVLFTVDWGDAFGWVPLIVSRSGEGEDMTTELIGVTGVEGSDESGTIIVTGQVGHFSSVEMWRVRGFFDATPHSASTEHDVGDEFDFAMTVKPNGRAVRFPHEWGWRYAYDEFSYAPGTTWGIEGEVTTWYKSVLKPHEQEILNRRGLTFHQSYEVTADLNCENEGDDSVRSGSWDHGLFVTYTLTHTGYHRRSFDDKEMTKYDKGEVSDHEMLRFAEDHECEEEKKGGWVRVNVPTTVICEGSGKSFTGYYEQDPVTGERIGDVLLDLETGEPANFTCD
ncbi:MAG: hypothetical protein U9Q03_02935 [Patescibacteria group bacterium]|nr:hypothetical protein [Patescibacteria group bacterium]